MKQSQEKGSLYLVPTPLGPSGHDTILIHNRDIVANCRHFVVESFKMGRRFVRAIAPAIDLDTCSFMELNKRTKQEEFSTYLDSAVKGKSVCLLSDSGSPTMADPGAPLVALAHRKGIRVVPLSGPSAIMLALMGSGLNGQSFTFHGYLSRDKNQVRRDLKSLEHRAKSGTTQIFMETPYRNTKLLEIALQVLSDKTLLCIACNLTQLDEMVMTQTISAWKKSRLPHIHKKPTIFLIGY